MDTKHVPGANTTNTTAIGPDSTATSTASAATTSEGRAASATTEGFVLVPSKLSVGQHPSDVSAANRLLKVESMNLRSVWLKNWNLRWVVLKRDEILYF